MTRMLLSLALAVSAALVPPPARAGDPRQGSLGELAARLHDLGQPLTAELRIELPPDRGFPLEALHAYLKENGFRMEAQVGMRDGRPVPGMAPLTLVARKDARFTPAQLDDHNARIAAILPEGTTTLWQFGSPREAAPAP